MSSSLRATGWRPSVADWGGGISVVLHRGSNCPLSRAMDGRIMRRGIISSCQSAATSEIVKRYCSILCKQRCSKYSDLYLYLLTVPEYSAHSLLSHPSSSAIHTSSCMSCSIFVLKTCNPRGSVFLCSWVSIRRRELKYYMTKIYRWCAFYLCLCVVSCRVTR